MGWWIYIKHTCFHSSQDYSWSSHVDKFIKPLSSNSWNMSVLDAQASQEGIVVTEGLTDRGMDRDQVILLIWTISTISIISNFQQYQQYQQSQHSTYSEQLIWTTLNGLRCKKTFFDSKLFLLRRVQQYLGCLPKPFHWPATRKKVLIILGPLGPEVCQLVTWKNARWWPEKCHLRT